jgi:hypothetical protein
MLAVHCARLDREVLIWTNAITGIDNTDHGVVVSYQCACGEAGQLLTGTRAKFEASAHAAA